MTRFNCTTAELATPEFLRLLAKATLKENARLARREIIRRALRLCGKLKPGATRERHSKRLIVALNQSGAV